MTEADGEQRGRSCREPVADPPPALPGDDDPEEGEGEERFARVGLDLVRVVEEPGCGGEEEPAEADKPETTEEG